MSYIGTSKIGKMFLGGTEISKAYLGDKLVYQNKPYDSEVEYLESTGTQYIDTGIVIDSTNYSIVSKAMLLNNRSSLCFVRWTPAPTYCTFGLYIGGTQNITYYYGNYKTLHYINNIPLSSHVNKERIYRLNEDSKLIIEDPVNGIITQINAVMDESVMSNSYSLYLFSANSNGILSETQNGIRVYSFTVKRNDNIVADFIPVRIGTNGYMYDKVSGQLFGNKGMGDFVLGPDVT